MLSGAAFIIYDGKNHRVLAARDRDGRQPLFWGATPDGRLLFSSDLADLAECNPSATAFPAGKAPLHPSLHTALSSH